MAVIVVEAGTGGGRAIAHALRALGQDAAITADPEAVARATRLIVAGAGPVAFARRALSGGLDEAIRLAVERGAPLLAVGSGFLVLLTGADDLPRGLGLGLFAGRAVPLVGGPEARLPHVGPDLVELRRREGPFVDLATRTEFAFAHELGARLDRREDVAGVCLHGEPLDVAVLAGNRAGILFHPERSGQEGLSLLGAFARWNPR